MKKSKFRLMALMMALLLALCRGCGISQCAALGGCLGLLTDLTAAQPTVLYLSLIHI